MSISQYVATFMKKMELVPYITPTKLSKVGKFANRLPVDFDPMVKLATTLEAAIRVAKSLEYVVKWFITDKAEVGEKRKNEESLGSNKKGR